MSRGKTSYTTRYKGKDPTLKRFFDLTNDLKITNSEIARRFEIADSAVRNWRNGISPPTTTNMEKIEDFIKKHEEAHKIPGYTLESVVARKDKKDSPIYTFKAVEKPAKDIGITNDELIEYAIKGMPEDVRMSLLKKFLKEGGR